MKYLNFKNLRGKLDWRSRNAIYGDMKAGRLPKPILLGGRNYWIEAEVDAAMQKLARDDSHSK